MTKKFSASITAHVGDEVMLIWEKDYIWNVTAFLENMPVLTLARRNCRFAEWEIDDGEDEIGTEYCQYVFYPDKNHMENYLLFVWTAFDAETGTQIL